jgi:hypothetical protein
MPWPANDSPPCPRVSTKLRCASLRSRKIYGYRFGCYCGVLASTDQSHRVRRPEAVRVRDMRGTLVHHLGCSVAEHDCSSRAMPRRRVEAARNAGNGQVVGSGDREREGRLRTESRAGQRASCGGARHDADTKNERSPAGKDFRRRNHVRKDRCNASLANLAHSCESATRGDIGGSEHGRGYGAAIASPLGTACFRPPFRARAGFSTRK